MKVVIIDDDPEIVEAVSFCFDLRWPEVEVLSANEGIDGLKLIEMESEVAGDIGKVIIDVVNPKLGEELLGKIPILVGGESSGLDIMTLDSIEEGQPLMQILNKQKQTIPSVRVYSDPDDAATIRKRFLKLYPAKAGAKDLHDEYDMTEA